MEEKSNSTTTDISADVKKLKERPPDESVIMPLVEAISKLASPSEQQNVVEQMVAALEGQASSLAELGYRLYSNVDGLEQLADLPLIAALRIDPTNERALDVLIRTLRHFSERAAAEPIVAEACALTGGDLRLLARWASWLQNARGNADSAVEVASEVAEGSLVAAANEPGDVSFLGPFVTALDVLGADGSAEVFERMLAALAGSASSLTALGRALLGAEPTAGIRAGAALNAALEEDPSSEAAVSALADLIALVRDPSTTRTVVNRALDLTDRNEKLLSAWALRLASNQPLLPETEEVVIEAGRRSPAQFERLAPYIIDYYGERRLADARRSWLDRLEVAGAGAGLLALWRSIAHRDEGMPQASVALATAALGGELTDRMRHRWELELFWSRMALGTMQSIDDMGPAVSEKLGAGWDSLDDEDAVHYGLMATRISLAAKRPAAARVALERTRTKVGRDYPLLAEPATAIDAAILALEDRIDLLVEPLPIREARGLGNLLSEPLASWRLKGRCLQEAKKSDTDQLVALHFEVGNTLGSLERYSEARQAYLRADELWTEPDQAEGFWVYGPYSKHNIADSFDREFAFDKASVAWDATIKDYERVGPADDPYLCWAHAGALLRRDRVVEAAQVCLGGLRLCSSGLDLLQLLIEIRHRDVETAARRQVERLEMARENPSSDLPRRLLAGDTQELRWRAREASYCLRSLLIERADASYRTEHQRQCASLLIMLNDVALARHYIDKAIDLDRDEPLNRALLGQWYEVQGEWTSALEAYDAAAKISPDNLEYQSSAGFMLARLKRYDEAEARYARLLTAAPYHVETLIRMAQCLLDRNETFDEASGRGAVELYCKVLKLHEQGTGSKYLSSAEMASILYQRGWCNIMLHQRSRQQRDRSLEYQAVHDFQRCLSIDPYHTKAKSALEQLQNTQRNFFRSVREAYGPWVVVALAVTVLVTTQVLTFTRHIDSIAWSAASERS